MLLSTNKTESLLQRAAVNLILPFINGLMQGFGELFAHEIAFRLGWGTQKIFPSRRITGQARAIPGVKIETDRDARRNSNLYTTMEP